MKLAWRTVCHHAKYVAAPRAVTSHASSRMTVHCRCGWVPGAAFEPLTLLLAVTYRESEEHSEEREEAKEVQVVH